MNVEQDKKDILPFQMQTPIDNSTRIIKVIGVGGGGGNAVNHMFKEGVSNVTFALCNTDNQALLKSDIDTKIQLGPHITNGLGAGNKPERAERAARESEDEIRSLLGDGTKMVFITAGMGGGTGTGAAPVIAGIAKEMGILTIGIVTLPFVFEGVNKILQAIDGVEKLKKNVDAMLIINNERLRYIYPDFRLDNAFKKADDTLSIAARSIVEIITGENEINLDFADVDTTLRQGGVAIISTGYGTGENRIEQAIEDALQSPLLDNSKIINTDRILINLTYSTKADVKVDEMTAIHNFMRTVNSDASSVIWGYGIDESLDDRVKITILAAGFDTCDFTDEARAEIEANDIQPKRPTISNEEKRQKIDNYYPIDKPIIKKTYQLHLFTDEEMQNTEILTKVEDAPTYRRSSDFNQQIEEIRQTIREKAQQIPMQVVNEPLPIQEPTAKKQEEE
jgi:cell division protein FtsZ